MRTHSPLVIDVRELLEAPGTRRALRFSAPLPQLEVGLVGVRGDLDFDLTLEAIDGGILVQGAVEGEYEGECGRCLKPIARPLRVRVAEVYRPAGEMWEEGYVISKESVDLELAVRDAVGLEIPLNPLCRPDCAGLCPSCGADLNEGRCDCPDAGGDLRWAALSDLLPPPERPDG